MKLAGDIGGTKVLLALVDGRGDIVRQGRLASADFSSFDDLLAEFLQNTPGPIEGGCLAVAGPIGDDGRTAKITNLPWTIDCTTLERRFRCGTLHLINDFAGVARGITMLGSHPLLTLQAGVSSPDGTRLVLGAGTGLGMAVLLADRILPSEGGHVGFAPQDGVQLRVWQALQAEHGRVTAERVISGPGLTAIHHILAGEILDPAVIAEQALAGNATARQTTDLFFSAYGAFAGDMAMAVMARGGVYLAGGVTQKLLPLLKASPFIPCFNAKAEHAGLVATMAVHVVTDPDVGLNGAIMLAQESQPRHS